MQHNCSGYGFAMRSIAPLSSLARSRARVHVLVAHRWATSPYFFFAALAILERFRLLIVRRTALFVSHLGHGEHELPCRGVEPLLLLRLGFLLPRLVALGLFELFSFVLARLCGCAKTKRGLSINQRRCTQIVQAQLQVAPYWFARPCLSLAAFPMSPWTRPSFIDFYMVHVDL